MSSTKERRAMSGKFAALANHLSTPSFGLIAVLFTADYFTGDTISQCPCNAYFWWRVCYAIIFLLCPIILCLIMDGSSFMVCWSKHPKKIHACCRPLFLSVLWLLIYLSSSRFSECLVPDLPCECPEPESKLCVEKKKIEPWVQTTVAILMVVLTLITAVFRCYPYKQKCKTVFCCCVACCKKCKDCECSSCCKENQVLRCWACDSRLNKYHEKFRISSAQNVFLCHECNENLRKEPVFCCCACNSLLNESQVRFRISSAAAQHVLLCCKCKGSIESITEETVFRCCACNSLLNESHVQIRISSAQNVLLCSRCNENLREEPVFGCCACSSVYNESQVLFRISSAQHVLLCCKCKGSITVETVPSDNWIQELDFGTIQKLHEHRLYNKDSGMSDLCNLSFEDVRRLDIPIGHQLIIIDEIKKRKKPDTPEDIQPEGHGAQANCGSIDANLARVAAGVTHAREVIHREESTSSQTAVDNSIARGTATGEATGATAPQGSAQ